MIIGHSVKLRVSSTDFDFVWLQQPNGSDIPLPVAEAPRAKPGDELLAFVYTDAEAKPVATVTRPAAHLGECANLKVKSITQAGAFLDWGIAKDLLLPYNEQRRPLQRGQKETVLVYLDNSGRLAATSRLDHHLGNDNTGFTAWQAVTLLVFQRTDLGFKAVVDNRSVGLLYKDEIFQHLNTGQQVTGYVKRLRDDKKLDLALQPPATTLNNELSDRVIEHLQKQQGVSSLTDKSPPEAIYAEFGVSKKNFKRALSNLYKQRRINILGDRVELVTKPK